LRHYRGEEVHLWTLNEDGKVSCGCGTTRTRPSTSLRRKADREEIDMYGTVARVKIDPTKWHDGEIVDVVV
jgi:hypothetical protein